MSILKNVYSLAFCLTVILYNFLIKKLYVYISQCTHDNKFMNSKIGCPDSTPLMINILRIENRDNNTLYSINYIKLQLSNNDETIWLPQCHKILIDR
jgi:hypothetical protein